MESRYESFDQLRNKIQESANDYCIKHGYKSGLVCKSLWANINESGHMNVGHHHANSALTGVYYPVDKIIDNKCNFNYTNKNPILSIKSILLQVDGKNENFSPSNEYYQRKMETW